MRNSNWAYRELLEETLQPDAQWLDLGCGHQLLPGWMPDAQSGARRLAGGCRWLVGIDASFAAVEKHDTLTWRLSGDIEQLPFCDASFDVVSANMVVEHVADPARVMSEVGRVLRPGGVFVLHTPNRLFYQIWLTLWVPPAIRRRAASTLEGRHPDDVFETRYRMNTRSTIARLAAAHGFSVDSVRMVNSGVATKRLGVLAIPELIVARLLNTTALTWARSNIIARLRKSSPPSGARA